MCRLFACHATAPTAVAWDLIEGPAALARQSCGDSRGECHTDGWGIGYYQAAEPTIIRAIAPAAESPQFTDAATTVRARTLIAHVRQASVGEKRLENTHPFVSGRWMFAHNGTVTGFDQVEPRIVAQTDPQFLACRQGTTDSELIFLWLLSAMRRKELLSGLPADPSALVALLAESTRTLAEWSRATGPEEVTKLNFLLTDGQVLLATRWLHSLWWREDEGPHSAGEAQHHAGSPLHRAVRVASEPTGDCQWREVPDGGVLAVDSHARGTVYSP